MPRARTGSKLQELIARVQALLRRSALREGQAAETYGDAYLTIDFLQREVRVGGGHVQLTPLEFRLLAAFVPHPRMVLSRAQLLELVWHDAGAASPDQVKLYVGYLRRKLDPEHPDRVPI